MKTRLSRRALLRGAALASAAFRATSASAAEPPRSVVFVHLRGGADGLSLLVPYADEHYYRARRVTAVARPGSRRAAALALDSRYALHPALAELEPLFGAGELAFVAGVGAPEVVRSHVAARRALDASIAEAFGAPLASSRAAPMPSLVELSRELATATAPRLVQLELAGWDTHAAQGDATSGRLSDAARELASLLVTLHRSLGALRERVLVVAGSEFGRSVIETPLDGTDDGHASLLVVLGGGRRWGEVYGRWPSLAPEARSAQRHVAVAVELRAVLGRLARGEVPA